ncbi:MAG: hypothetical protein INR62_04160 [Rhodospirillales bacterium]|nr:hypothetical protein [Acetobacter sp.]
MTGKELWEQYQHYTHDLTEHGRKLGFAGAAICWLFKDQAFTFPALIYLSLLFFVAYFIADILQGFLGAVMVRRFTEREEAKLWESNGSIEGEIQKPRSVDAAAFACFVLKCLFLLLGFLLIGFELVHRLLS